MSIAATTNALTTIARLKLSGLGGSASDDALQMAINAISAHIERKCDRVFRALTYKESPDTEAGELEPELVPGSGRTKLLLSTYPITAVTKVTVAGSEIADFQLIPDLAESGMLYRRSGWPRVEGAWGPLVLEPNGEPDYSIAVSYTGGFATIPADLELAVMHEVDNLAGGRKSRSVQKERTPGGWAITYDGRQHYFAMSSVAVFEDYRRLSA